MIRRTAGRSASAIMSGDAVVWRMWWKRIGRTSPTGQSFILHFGHRRTSPSGACTTWPQPLRRQVCRQPVRMFARRSARLRTCSSWTRRDSRRPSRPTSARPSVEPSPLATGRLAAGSKPMCEAESKRQSGAGKNRAWRRGSVPRCRAWRRRRLAGASFFSVGMRQPLAAEATMLRAHRPNRGCGRGKRYSKRRRTVTTEESASRVLSSVDRALPDLEALYKDLHTHPELSMQEARTAEVAADRLRKAGYEVTTGVGRTGVVGLLRNGTGPMVMLRADMERPADPRGYGARLCQQSNGD